MNIEEEVDRIKRALNAAEAREAREKAKLDLATEELINLGVSKKDLKNPDALLKKLKRQLADKKEKVMSAIGKAKKRMAKYE